MDEEKEKLEWEKTTKIGNPEMLNPVLNALLLIIEAEKKKTLEQIDQVKQLLETMKNKK